MTEREPLLPLSESQREELEEATTQYAAALADTRSAARYLLDRGISREAAVSFRLGVVANPLPGHEKFEGWIVIPYLGHEDQPLDLRFRCPQNHEHRDQPFKHGKYMSSWEAPTRIYNVRAIHQAKDVIHLAEGELDAVVLNMVGLPAIAVPGADAWQHYHRRMLDGFTRIWLWTDPDDKGAKLRNTVQRSLAQAKAVRLSGGDVNDIYLAGGADALHSLIQEDAK